MAQFIFPGKAVRECTSTDSHIRSIHSRRVRHISVHSMPFPFPAEEESTWPAANSSIITLFAALDRKWVPVCLLSACAVRVCEVRLRCTCMFTKMVFRDHRFFQFMLTCSFPRSSTSVGNSIVRARLGPNHMYIITGAEYVKAAFGSSKNLTFDSRTIQIMEQVYGLPAGDAAPYKRSPGKAKELVSKLDQLYIANLANRECTAAMIRQFVKSLNAQVGCLRNDKGTEVMIGACLRRLMATASISALFGDAIIENNATFVQDYWIFSKDFKRLLYGMPKLFCRKGVHARDRMLKAIKAFILDALQDDVGEMEPKSPTVESSPPYVSPLVRETNKFFTEAGFSVEGRASEALSLVFA